MQRILAIDEPQNMPPEPPAPEVSSNFDFKEDFELVVGRRQVAAISFLALVLVVVCSGGAYLAGKAISAREEAAQPVIKIEAPPAPIPPPAPLLAPKPAPEAPLFGNPNPKAIYIQVGAVEKGVAIVIALGLRKYALDSFVAPGPSTKSFRVLIGPFADAEAYQKARNLVDQIGLDSFARRYEAQ
jgi:hypothetical protein